MLDSCSSLPSRRSKLCVKSDKDDEMSVTLPGIAMVHAML